MIQENLSEADRLSYPGDYYREIGDFIREAYLKFGFAQGTGQEVDFLTELLALPHGAMLLDVGCGPGRHSMALARRGYPTVGIDISGGFVKYAEQQALREDVPAKFMEMDAREMKFEQMFDAAVCLCEGAFGLAGNEEDHRKVLRGVHRALKPGAPFVLTVVNALNLARTIPLDAPFDAYTCTTFDREEVQSPEGQSKLVNIYTTAFTYREMKWLLAAEGFEVEAAYDCCAGAFGKKPLRVDSMEMMLVCRRLD